jgi:cytochrome c biogenesis protein CcmG, thiol:disulfide interchange protein DsbE
MTRMIDNPAPEANRWLPGWIIFLAVVVLFGLLSFLAMGLVQKQQRSLVLGSQVRDFSLTTFDGHSLKLSELKGKTVLVNFWSSWCTTCIDEATILGEAWQRTKGSGQVVFIGVDYADTQSAALAFMDKYGVDYSNAPDLRSAISQQFHISGVPETYLIGSDGTLRAIKIGPFSSTAEALTFINTKLGN